MTKRRIKNQNFRAEFDVDDILQFVGWKKSYRKLLKVNETR